MLKFLPHCKAGVGTRSANSGSVFSGNWCSGSGRPFYVNCFTGNANNTFSNTDCSLLDFSWHCGRISCEFFISRCRRNVWTWKMKISLPFHFYFLPPVMGGDEWPWVGNRGVLLQSTDDASTCRHAETGFWPRIFRFTPVKLPLPWCHAMSGWMSRYLRACVATLITLVPGASRTQPEKVNFMVRCSTYLQISSDLHRSDVLKVNAAWKIPWKNLRSTAQCSWTGQVS